MKVDDEGYVLRTRELSTHPMLPKQYNEIPVYEISVSTSTGIVNAYMPTKEGARIVRKTEDELASKAKKERMYWPHFWGFKESFADLRPSHALTSHRSQGSTYTNVFVDANDILCNRNSVEALKSLYVSVTRAAKSVVIKR